MHADHQMVQKLFAKMMDIVFLIPLMMDGSASANQTFMEKIARRVSLLHDLKIRFDILVENFNLYPILIYQNTTLFINLANPCHNPQMDYLNPCHNGGTCSFDANFNVSCECPPEWTGEFCDEGIKFKK